MRVFQYNEFDGEKGWVETITEEKILEEYYPYYYERMKEVGKEDEISKERCIEDFLTIHWGWEVK